MLRPKTLYSQTKCSKRKKTPLGEDIKNKVPNTVKFKKKLSVVPCNETRVEKRNQLSGSNANNTYVSSESIESSQINYQPCRRDELRLTEYLSSPIDKLSGESLHDYESAYLFTETQCHPNFASESLLYSECLETKLDNVYFFMFSNF